MNAARKQSTAFLKTFLLCMYAHVKIHGGLNPYPELGLCVLTLVCLLTLFKR